MQGIDPIEIAKRYAAGESMQALAAEHKIHRQRLYETLLGGLGDEKYSELVTSALIRRVSESDEALENTSIEPDTARAHARARFARMDLERRRPQLYGAKQETLAVNIAVQIVAFSEGNRHDIMPVLTHPAASLPAPQQSAREQHLIALASLSRSELRALQAEVESRIAAGRSGSPVAPGLVDSGGDQSASIVSERGS